MGLLSFLDRLFAKENEKLKERFKADIAGNINTIIDNKGRGAINMHVLEQEVIYYACDILLHQKSQAGRLPADNIMTDIISCAATAMKELFPNNYTEQQAAFAQEAVRTNLASVPNLQQVVDSYYAKQRQSY